MSFPSPLGQSADVDNQPGSSEKLSADAAITIGGTPAKFATFIAVGQQR